METMPQPPAFTPPPASAEPGSEAPPAWLLAVLEALPLALAVRGPAGPVFRNAAHRALAPHDPEPGDDELADLGLGQVTDSASGRVYLRTRTPLHARGAGDTGPEPLALELLEDITGRHSDRDEIARQRDALARHARALERANRELSQLERAKSEFIALAAHEVRTPLTALSNAVQLLRRAPAGGASPDAAERFLSMADRNVRRLADLADDLLEFTQLEARHLDLEVAPVDPTRLLAGAVADLEARAAAAEVGIARHAGAPAPVLHGDPARLGQVMRNLLAHAVRRAPAGSTVRAAAAALDAWDPAPPGAPGPPRPPAPPRGWVELAVEAGAPGTVEPHVTDLGSFAADGAEVPDGRAGTGLDLAVCRRIVDLHGGAAWSEEAPGWRRLVVRLPRLSAADARLLAAHDVWRWLRQRRDDARVVVVRTDPGAPLAEDLRAACAGATAPDGAWVTVPGDAGDGEGAERAEIVGVVAGDGAVAAATRALAASEGCSGAEPAPIRVGWAAPGPDGGFDEALARARAAARPLGRDAGVETEGEER